MTRRWGFALLLAAVLLLSTQGVLAQGDEWHFGIGTGFFALNLEGDLGVPFKNNGPPTRGHETHIDLDNSEISDYMESAFGLGGFASKGKWAILYSAGSLSLEDDDEGLDAKWDRFQFQVAGVYTFWTGEKNKLGFLFGVRYISHDWDLNGRPRVRGVETRVRSDFDEDWTDAIVGLTHSLAFSEKWSWSSQLNGGGGGSEGTFMLNSGINWHFAKHWQLRFYVQSTSIDFESGSKGDSDYYLYDVDESGVGIGITVVW